MFAIEITMRVFAHSHAGKAAPDRSGHGEAVEVWAVRRVVGLEVGTGGNARRDGDGKENGGERPA
ncbi:hypothetical protein GCM10011611_45720 [Aliidongia dinghuensis]|uniref:Uncharacterized protein n=1 Tax=Aliidongia dinghuensis TaxID=1867774 RepID=A0A8J2YY29_9PROT|nr:hypothetical protein GCM10011611_45720 [Aliidongia dinghuensis]